MEPPALSVFDTSHSQAEERWFTLLGMASDGKLLAVSHANGYPAFGDAALPRTSNSCVA